MGRHPGCDGSLSVIAGDSPGDMELARNVSAVTAGCASIRIGGDELNAMGIELEDHKDGTTTWKVKP